MRLRAMTGADLPFVGVVDLRPGARGNFASWGVAARAAADLALRPVGEGGFGLRRPVADSAEEPRATASSTARGSRPGREEAAEAPDGSVGPAIHWERLA